LRREREHAWFTGRKHEKKFSSSMYRQEKGGISQEINLDF